MKELNLIGGMKYHISLTFLTSSIHRGNRLGLSRMIGESIVTRNQQGRVNQSSSMIVFLSADQ